MSEPDAKDDSLDALYQQQISEATYLLDRLAVNLEGLIGPQCHTYCEDCTACRTWEAMGELRKIVQGCMD